MEKILSHKRYGDKGIVNISKWRIIEEEKSKVKRFIEKYLNGDITAREPKNLEALKEKLPQLLRPILEQYPISKKPQKEDTERIATAFTKGTFKSFSKKDKAYNGKPYSKKSKTSMLAVYKQYLKTEYPNNPELLIPLNKKFRFQEEAKQQSDEFETFSIPEEADRLRDNCGDVEKRGFFSLLMGGFRIEEAMNVYSQNVTLLDNYAEIEIKNKTSKTAGRKIKIYYLPALEDIRALLKLRKDNEPLINLTYFGIKEWIERLSIKTFGSIKEDGIIKQKRRLTAHMFRHSVATWLASKLDRNELCYYFGWKFSSNMPDVYISRAGFKIKDADKKIDVENMQDLKDKVKRTDTELLFQKDLVEELSRRFNLMQKYILEEGKTERSINLKDLVSPIKKTK